MSDSREAVPQTNDPDKKIACTPGRCPRTLAQRSAFFIRRYSWFFIRKILAQEEDKTSNFKLQTGNCVVPIVAKCGLFVGQSFGGLSCGLIVQS